MKNDALSLDWKKISILGVLFILVFFLWQTPIVYPIKLFVVFLHELSHGLAAELSGGDIVSIELDYRLGGLCTTQGGIRFIVASAGYLGSLLWGGIILVITSRTRFSSVVSFALGIMVIIVTLFYIPIGAGWLFTLPFAAALIALSLYTSKQVSQLLLMFIGITSCLYAVLDIKQDLWTMEFRGSDADAMASITGIPAIVWGLLWSLLSIAGLVFFLYLSIRRSSLQEQVAERSNLD